MERINLGFPPEVKVYKLYKLQLVEKMEQVIKKMRWKTIMSTSDEHNNNNNNNNNNNIFRKHNNSFQANFNKDIKLLRISNKKVRFSDKKTC